MNAGFQQPRVCGFLQFAAVAACFLLVSCGGSGGGGGGGASSAPTATTTPSPPNNPVVPSAPVVAADPSTLPTIVATAPASNVAEVVIDSGPAGVNGIINVPYVSVTLCRPNTSPSICQTIDHVLVDTGSYGLRIIAPGVLDPTLALPAVIGTAGNLVGNCAQFVSGFLWGSVRRADVKIAGETASSLPVQQVSDADAAFPSIPPSGCTNTGGNIGTVARLGAKGILGIGLFNQDCGSRCTTQVANGNYYECSASTCAGTVMPLANQVANPVPLFTTDNNGVALVMPVVPAGGATTLTGALVFGIDTQANNNIGSATVYAANSSGNFTTTYKGTLLRSSFLDSGSNGLFFPDPTITRCPGSPDFYCPSATLPLSAVNSSANGATGTVNFSVENLEALDATVRAASVGGSLGSTSRPRAFDWGLPFFFGRTVFVAIDGESTLHGPGPYWAY